MHYRKYDFSDNVSSERGWQDHQQRERDHKEDAETDSQCTRSGRGYDSYSHSAQKRSGACATKPASIYAEKKSSYRAKLARQESAECIRRICCYAVDEGVIEITEEFHLTSIYLPPLDWRRTASGRNRPVAVRPVSTQSRPSPTKELSHCCGRLKQLSKERLGTFCEDRGKIQLRGEQTLIDLSAAF